jgi:hypothetical protein
MQQGVLRFCFVVIWALAPLLLPILPIIGIGLVILLMTFVW